MDETITNRRRSAVATFFGSTSTTVLAAVQALLLIPLYLDRIGSKLYGGWLATGGVLGILLAFDMGIPNLLIQRVGVAWAKGDRRAIGAYLGTGGSILLAFAALVGLCMYFAAGIMPPWVGLSGADAAKLCQALQIGALATTLTISAYLFHGLTRGLQDTVLVNVFTFVGALVGFVVTFVLVSRGYGLTGIALGLVIRSCIGLLGGFAFSVFVLDPGIRRSICVDRAISREFIRLSPPIFLAGLATSAMSNSQVFLAGVLIGPEAAVVLGVTRKAAELVGMLLQAVGHAAYGGFSHLVASASSERSRAVYREIMALYLGIGFALMSGVVAANPSFVSVWAGRSSFGGPLLSCLLAASILASGWSALSLGLFRALGRHQAASVATIVECIARLAVMTSLTLWWGLVGVAAGAIFTGTLSGLWANMGIMRSLPGSARTIKVRSIWLMRALIVGIAIACGYGVSKASWVHVVFTGVAFASAGIGLMFGLDPNFSRTRSQLGRRLMVARP